jgi:hypothetical protein
MPDRIAEFGVDPEGGFGNSLLRIRDVFNANRTLLIGLSAFTIFGCDTLCFNAGLESRFNIINMPGFSVSTGYAERQWKHGLGLRLNFRVIGLDAKFSLWGPDLKSSFKARGLGVSLGIRLGF